MIQITNAFKSFNISSEAKTHALQNINLTIQEGEFVVLIGSNGSGKSTLLNSIAGSILLDSGTISINNIDVTNKVDFERSHLVARLFQNPLNGTATEMSIIENFRLAALRTEKKKLKIGINEQFRKDVQDKISILNMGLEDKLDLPIGVLSGGQRQALTLIMASMCDIKVLLMDEPVAALDPRSAEIVMQAANNLVHELKLTTILVTHRMRDVIDYGNRIIFMNEGKIEKDIDVKGKANLQLMDIVNWF